MRDGRRYVHERAVESMHAYADEVATRATSDCDPRLAWLGFTRPQKYYRGLAGGIPFDLQRRFPTLCPMVYGTDPAGSLDRTRDAWPLP